LTNGAAKEFTAPETDDEPPVGVVGRVELANDAVVAEVTVNAHGAWALVLIDGNEPDELELDGTVSVGGGGGVGIVELVEEAADDPLKGDGGGAPPRPGLRAAAAGGGGRGPNIRGEGQITRPTPPPAAAPQPSPSSGLRRRGGPSGHLRSSLRSKAPFRRPPLGGPTVPAWRVSTDYASLQVILDDGIGQ